MTATLDPLTALQQPMCRHGRCTRLAHPHAGGLCTAHAYPAGALRHYVDAAPVAAHIHALNAPATAIAQAAGVSHQAIYNIRGGASPRTKATVAEAILAVTHDDLPAIGYRPTWPAARRIQALRAAGWRLDELANHTGVHKESLSDISKNLPDRIFATTDQAIRRCYRTLGPAIKRPAVWSVARQGWPLPAEWDNPDNPDEDPAVDRVAYDEDYLPVLDYIINHHGDRAAAARALGTHQSTIYRIADGERTPSPDVRQKLAEHYIHLHGAAA